MKYGIYGYHDNMTEQTKFVYLTVLKNLFLTEYWKYSIMVIFAFAKHVVPECMNDSWITSSSINASIWYESLKYLYVGFVTPMGAPTVRD
jgi:hypothetical protein